MALFCVPPKDIESEIMDGRALVKLYSTFKYKVFLFNYISVLEKVAETWAIDFCVLRL